ncbi:PLP-dependent cysteine synthase family protein [Deinococcus pimensis]|uniref:PLP-dependent cysteine synthase family protein n=1 Tax=Deinococcus pimensis TaxID=309888 RepID=UPI000488302A|nr:cysteine synthase family protein [Deinococcus pimensis]
MPVLKSVLDAIGHTPLVALDRAYEGPGRLLAKLEFVQPGGSVKDRAALAIVRRALERGDLLPGQGVVEMTSGNMGAGLAVVCAVLGHEFTAVMSSGNSSARVAMLRGLGAHVELVPQVDGLPGQVTGADIGAASARARELAHERGWYLVDQFHNPGSVLAHEEGTGPELWRGTEGRLDAFVALVGSGGTFVGTSRFLKRAAPHVLCVAVEPAGAEVLAGRAVTKPRHLLQGTGYGSVPPKWDADLADAFVAVTDEEALEWRERLARREGLFVGFSAAANVCAAVKLLRGGRLREDACVATVLCDTGLKYVD